MYLGNYHVGLVHADRITNADLQLFHYAYIVQAGTAHRGTFQFDGPEYGYGVDQPCPGRAPLYLLYHSFFYLVPPFESDGIPREFRRSPQRFAVSDVVKSKDKSVGRQIIPLDVFSKPSDRFLNGFRVYHAVFHYVESLGPEPFQLRGARIAEIDSVCPHKRKCEEIHVPLRGHPVVQLTYRTAAEIPRVLVF